MPSPTPDPPPPASSPPDPSVSPSSPSLGSLLTQAARRLRLGPEGISPRREARALVEAVLGLASGTLTPADDAEDPSGRSSRVPIPDGASEQLADLVTRRLAGEPLSRILGWREFWSLTLALSPDTLDPRPDTETLVDAGLDALAAVGDGFGRPLRLLDLGTGTGCVLLALLTERPEAIGLGVDIAPGAVITARANARALGLEGRALFVVGDWTAAVRGPFDLVVSNPPYIPTGDLAGLDRAVRAHDPRRALDGGPDGLAAYRRLAAGVPPVLAPGAALAVEVGIGQAEAVATLFAAAGLTVEAIRPDLAGIPRCVTARRPLS